MHWDSPFPGLVRCSAVILSADPARSGRFAFRLPKGASASSSPSLDGLGRVEEVTVVAEDARARSVTALSVPVRDALPLLVRARAMPDASPSVAFWGAAALLALHLVARGRLLPGLSAAGHDAWRVGPLGVEDVERLRRLAASMPPTAHAVPVGTSDGTVLLPDPEVLLRAFLDSVADVLPRTPAAPLAAGGPAFAGGEPRHLPGLRAWAAEVAAGHDAGVRLSLRIEMSGLDGDSGGGTERPPAFRAVPQLHSVADPGFVADAADVWSGGAGGAFGAAARRDALLALRRAVRAWPAPSPLLSAAVPASLELADEEVSELLGEAGRVLAQAGVPVHWPRRLARSLTTRAEIGPVGVEDAVAGGRAGAMPSFLSPDALLAFDWRFALGDELLSRAELDRLAEAARPVVRLRDQWVLVDPEQVRRARERRDHKVTTVEALGAVLTGTAEVDGHRVEVLPSGWLRELRDRLLADPESGQNSGAGQEPGAGHGWDAVRRPEFAQPAGLAATLRGYQLRGLNWLHRMTSLGLGACLADDMGLGKTITLIFPVKSAC